MTNELTQKCISALQNQVNEYMSRSNEREGMEFFLSVMIFRLDSELYLNMRLSPDRFLYLTICKCYDLT